MEFEIVSWINILGGIGLIILAFILGFIFSGLSVDNKWGNLSTAIALIIVIAMVIVGGYSFWVGLGLPLP